MSCTDLTAILSKDDITLDVNLAKRVVSTVMKLVEDNISEVQNQAVKWYLKSNSKQLASLH